MSFLTRGEYKFDNTKMSSTTTADEAPKKSDQHTTAMRSLKKLMKPLLRLMRKKQLLRKTLAEIQQQNAYNDSLEDMRRAAALNANDDNLANEALEQRIYNEIRQCPTDAAIIVEQAVVAVHPQQQFIPVHFARTSSGTFFWTSVDVVAREQELRLRAQLDRWGQA